MAFNKSEALETAKQYVLQRNLQVALEIYLQIAQVDPADLSARNTLGDLFASTGNIKEAINQFSQLATIYIDGGFSRKAITALKKIIAIDPANIETAIRLADLYAEAGLPSEARQHYLQIAEALTRKGQRLEALNVYTKVVELDPMNTPTRIKLGELCLREGMNDQAYDAFMIAADQLAQKGEHRRALNAYNEALSIKPGSAEAMTAAQNLTAILGVADRGPTKVNTRELVSEKTSTPKAAQARSQTPVDEIPKNTESSFVVQEISKAEILVAYGQVTQALGMLKNVLKENADSVDVHVKLKDIYLRTGMMAEAATECRELERIHQSRGESDRARDYAIRANRLTNLLEQPSGDLDASERRKIPSEPQVREVPPAVVHQRPAASPAKPAGVAQNPAPVPTKPAAVPQSPASTPASAASTQRPEPAASTQRPAPAASTQRPAPAPAKPDVVPQRPAPVPAKPAAAPQRPAPAPSRPAFVLQNPGPIPAKPKQAQPQPLPVTARIDLPVAQQSRIQVAVVEETPATAATPTPELPSARAASELRSPDTTPVLGTASPAAMVLETPVAMVTAKVERSDESTHESSLAAVPREPAEVAPSLFATSLLAIKARKLPQTLIAAAALLFLAISTVIGGFAYNNFLDNQYRKLAEAAPPLATPPPPAELQSEEFQTQAGQNETSNNLTVTAGATNEAPTRRESREPESIKSSPTPTPTLPASQPTKATPMPSPVLPRASFSPDTTVGADGRNPAGVPLEVAIGANQQLEPPAKPVRQSPGVVMGSATKKVDPAYPSAARSSGQSGVVRVEVLISERGDVVSARALSGPALLQNAAVTAARAWKFKASTLGGVPVKTTTTIVFNFKL
jgi:protein TonB